MSKGIAIQTILYLLIGVLVVGILVYLVYSYVLNPVLPETQCRILATSWCTSCKTAGWTGGPEPSGDLQTCWTNYWSASVPSNLVDDCHTEALEADTCCYGAGSGCASVAGIS